MDSTTTNRRPEIAPSAAAADVPSASRIAGSVGLLLAVLGTATLIAAEYGRGILPIGAGYFASIFGVAAMLLHALRDSEVEIRRMYGSLAGLLFVAAVATSIVPGGESRSYGNFLLPWGLGLGFISLLFFAAFLRHENEEPLSLIAQRFVLVVAGLLMIVPALVGIVSPEFLVGKGLLLSLLGLGFLCIFLNVTNTDAGLGYQAAVALAVLGTLALVVAVGRSIAPSVLHEGPSAIRTPFITIDPWKLIARLSSIGFCLGFASLAFMRSLPLWFRSTAAVFGIALAGVFIAGTITRVLINPPAPFLVPHGLILGGLGVLYLAVSLGVLSESAFVVLTRREFTAYFYSPIAYFVLIGMSFMGMISYIMFLSQLASAPSIPEPVVQYYFGFGLVGAIVAIFLVPILSMRLFSEERRTGTYEVLLTAPVQEWVVVLSKFFSCWLFFLLSWLPMGLYLLTLPLVGTTFDYRPILSFYLALACTGAGFIAMGTFFSSLTKNQIVAAVLTAAMMFFYLLTIIADNVPGLGEGIKSVLTNFSFLSIWSAATKGELALQTIAVHLSLAALWLFLTTKILEIRKWS